MRRAESGSGAQPEKLAAWAGRAPLAGKRKRSQRRCGKLSFLLGRRWARRSCLCTARFARIRNPQCSLRMRARRDMSRKGRKGERKGRSCIFHLGGNRNSDGTGKGCRCGFAHTHLCRNRKCRNFRCIFYQWGRRNHSGIPPARRNGPLELRFRCSSISGIGIPCNNGQGRNPWKPCIQH